MAFQWEAVTALSAIFAGVGGLVTLLVNRVVSDRIHTLEEKIDLKLDTLYQRINGTYVRSGTCMAWRETQAAQASVLAATLAAKTADAARDIYEEHSKDLRYRVERLEDSRA